MGLGHWIGLFVLGVSVYILWQIRQILFLVFLSVILATALNRVVREIQQLGIKREIAIALCLGIVLTLIVSFIGMVLPAIIEQSQQLIAIVPEGLERVRVWQYWLQARIPWQAFQTVENLSGMMRQLPPLITWLFVHFYQWFHNGLSFFLNLLLVIVLTIMFLVNPRPYRRSLILLFPAFYRDRADSIVSQCEASLIGWIIGVASSMSFIAVMSFLGLAILQVPLTLIHATLAGLCALIPYMGAILSVIPPVAIALLDAPWKAIAVIGLYFLIQQIEGNIFTPLVMKQQVSLLPAVTLSIMTAFGVFFGILGLFLALPIVIVAQIWLKELLIKDVLDRWQKEVI